jgi:hypothetical protein
MQSVGRGHPPQRAPPRNCPQGERQPRLQGEEYYGVVEELCRAVKSVWPNALLQVRAR